MVNLPKISIVTPSFNQGTYIEQTILSIVGQGYENVELIIIDGGSTDNTLEIIKKYRDKIAYWVSEPDHGQADAINKGLAVATGEVFNWINSDDILEPGSLLKIAMYFKTNPDKKVLCGFTRCFFDDDNSTSHEYRMGVKQNATETILAFEMNQPGTFYRMDILKIIGGVNESLRYVFDDELWFRYLATYGTDAIGVTDVRLAQFRLHKSSKSVHEGFELFVQEIQSIYIDIAKAINAPAWMIGKMTETDHSRTYRNAAPWPSTFINSGRFAGFFAVKYINSLYLAGKKDAAKEAFKLLRDNHYFKWNRLLVSLWLKLLF